jgi:hypothetical protein
VAVAHVFEYRAATLLDYVGGEVVLLARDLFYLGGRARGHVPCGTHLIREHDDLQLCGHKLGGLR